MGQPRPALAPMPCLKVVPAFPASHRVRCSAALGTARAESEGEMRPAGRATMPRQRPKIGSRMNREVHVLTPYEDERLRTLALSGATVPKIAEQIKRSEPAVRRPAPWLKIVVAKRKAKGK